MGLVDHEVSGNVRLFVTYLQAAVCRMPAVRAASAFLLESVFVEDEKLLLKRHVLSYR